MTYPLTDFAGTAIATADGVLGISAAPTRVFAMHVLSGGGGGGIVQLRSGAAVSATIWIKESGTASTGKTFNYGRNGHLFPDGVYVDVDANVTSVVIAYSQ